MKKIFTVVCAIALALALTLVPTLAEEVAETPEVTPKVTENVTPEVTEPEETPTTPENSEPSEVLDGEPNNSTPENENATEGEILGSEVDDLLAEVEGKIAESESLVSAALDILTDGSVWTAIITSLAGLIGTIAVIYKKFGALVPLVKAKADATTMTNALKEVKKDLASEIREDTEKAQAALAAKQAAVDAKLDKFLALFSIMTVHSKALLPSVRAELMDMITGVKETSGSLEDIFTEAKANIEAAQAEYDATKTDTPVLDKLVAEAEAKEAAEAEEELTVELG